MRGVLQRFGGVSRTPAASGGTPVSLQGAHAGALARPCRWKWPSCAHGTTLAHRRRNRVRSCFDSQEAALPPPSLSPGALSLMHCTSLCRGAPFCQRAPKQAILPCRQRTSLGSAALRCRLLGAHQDWRTNTARDANRPRLPLSRSPRAAEHAPPQSVDQARMSPRAPL